MTDEVESWHVAWVKPGAEKKVEEEARRENYATLLLWECVRKRIAVRGRPGCFTVDWIHRVLYPRYVFIGARPGQGLLALKDIEGISEILRVGDRYVVVPHRIIDDLAKWADAEGVVRRIDKTLRREFKEGEKVVIRDGSPLAGFVGTVSQDCGKEVRVWLTMIGSNREVAVSPSLLAPQEEAG